MKRGPLPFRFENMWLKEEGFKDLLNLGRRGLTLAILPVSFWLQW